MITKTIKIYTFSDLKKWLWNALFFPKRKEIAEWLKFHDDKNQEKVLELIVTLERLRENNEQDIALIKAINEKLTKIFVKQREESQQIITKMKE